MYRETNQGRIQDFHWVGAAGHGGAVLAIEGAPLIDQKILHFLFLIYQKYKKTVLFRNSGYDIGSAL